MKIGTKNIIIDKNIDEVKNDLKKLCGNSNIEDFKNKIEIFHGKIKENIFIFDCDGYHRLATPELHGELFECGDNRTLIKIEYFVEFFHIIFCLGGIIFAIYAIIKYLIPEWSERNLYLNIFSFLFYIPIIECYFKRFSII